MINAGFYENQEHGTRFSSLDADDWRIRSLVEVDPPRARTAMSRYSIQVNDLQQGAR